MPNHSIGDEHATTQMPYWDDVVLSRYQLVVVVVRPTQSLQRALLSVVLVAYTRAQQHRQASNQGEQAALVVLKNEQGLIPGEQPKER